MYLIISKFVRLGLLHELPWSGFPKYLTAEHDNQPIVKGYHGFPSLPETWLRSKLIVRACRP